MELDSPKNTRALIVSGGGSDLERGSVIGRLIQQNLTSRGIFYKNIQGSHVVDGVSVVRTPSEQYNEIMENIESAKNNERILIMSHCIGLIASQKALDSVMNNPNHEVNLLSISPPLPSPTKLLNTPKSSARRTTKDDGTFTMKTMHFKDGHFGDFSQTVVMDSLLPYQYFVDASEAYDLGKHLKLSTELGRSAIIGTEKDWNTPAPNIIQNWQKEWQNYNSQVALDHSVIINGVGHSLNQFKDNNHPNPDIRVQQDSVNKAIELGLSTFENN